MGLDAVESDESDMGLDEQWRLAPRVHSISNSVAPA